MRGRPAFAYVSSAIVALSAVVCVAAHADEKAPLSFIDPADGQLDMSDFLLKHKGALPVPIVITEPAVGYGAGLGLLFFSGPIAEAAANSTDAQPSRSPPNVTALGGMYTQNGTWAAAAAHFHTWDDDRYRYLGAVAKVDAHLDYFGLTSQARAYTLSGEALVQQFLVRLGSSRWYGGVRYVFFDTTSSFTGGTIPASISNFQRNQRIGAGSLILDYDSRDNIFYPASGSFAEFEAQFARTGLGGTQNYDVYAARGFKWIPLTHALILGLRVDTRFSTGDIPFYAQPYVDLRGVQKGRYQDRNAISTEAELRWDVTPRWSLLGFTGIGKAYGRLESFSQAQNVTSVGAGFRYLIARKLGLAVGIDVAHSKDQNAFYIQVGSAWR
ncbi:BamA/TamA family outer membrane protein [Paraburkholderia acidiphila]|uniref:BamA/TamA family outer membrane protein n=1 Tax=Paraburkholderia acidiphila TaxID=2571747 RepID=A0A7Z2JCA3_9BURK|nr:BamA/TamA family outer membrane protein [Paraburkholderia acidiphila]QGZ57740.1 BamA/TamA family outer membrane protein [Paraburkholderia acidiphila]